jgi:hypothetical protein
MTRTEAKPAAALQNLTHTIKRGFALDGDGSPIACLLGPRAYQEPLKHLTWPLPWTTELLNVPPDRFISAGILGRSA